MLKSKFFLKIENGLHYDDLYLLLDRSAKVKRKFHYHCSLKIAHLKSLDLK